MKHLAQVYFATNVIRNSVVCTLLMSVVASAAPTVEDYRQYYINRERLQSLTPQSDEALGLFQGPLYNELGYELAFGSDITKGVLESGYRASSWLEDYCLDPRHEQKCVDVLGGQHRAVVAFRKALSVDDVVVQDKKKFNKLKVDDKARKDLMDRTFMAYGKCSGWSEDKGTYKLYKDRYSAAFGEAAFAALAGKAGDCRVQDEAFLVDNIEASNKTLRKVNTTIRKMFPKPFAEDVTKFSSQAVAWAGEVDNELKTAISGASVQALGFFSDAQSATSTALSVAEFLNVDSDIVKKLAEVNDVAQKGMALANIGLTLGRASIGDFTAYADAFRGVTKLFGGGGLGGALGGRKGPDPQVLRMLNLIVDNQRKIIKRLDYLIEQNAQVKALLLDIQESVITVDSNVRYLLSANKEILKDDFANCYQKGKQLRRQIRQKKSRALDVFSAPYDEELYTFIVAEAKRYRRTENFIDNCTEGVSSVFKDIEFGYGPSNIFYPTFTNIANQTVAIRQQEAFEKRQAHFLKIHYFFDLYAEVFGNDAKINNYIDLIRLAITPASAIQDIDKKYELLIAGKVDTNYLFGADNQAYLIDQFDKLLDYVAVIQMARNMYEVLPYVWVKEARASYLVADLNGLDQLDHNTFISAALNSVDLILMASAQQTLMQGDVLLPLLYDVVTHRGAIANQVNPINRSRFAKQLPKDSRVASLNTDPRQLDKEQEENRVALMRFAFEILEENAILRENFIRYVVYRAYYWQKQDPKKTASRAIYRMDYTMAYFPQHFSWAFKLDESLNAFPFKKTDNRCKAIACIGLPRTKPPKQPKAPVGAGSLAKKAEKFDFNKELIGFADTLIDSTAFSEKLYYYVPLTEPDDYARYAYEHSAATKSLFEGRVLGNRFLAVLEAYHPNNGLIRASGN